MNRWKVYSSIMNGCSVFGLSALLLAVSVTGSSSTSNTSSHIHNGQVVWPTGQNGYQIVNGGWLDTLGFYHSSNEQIGQNSWIAIQIGYVDSQGRFYYPINGEVQGSIRQGECSTGPHSLQIVNGGWVDTLGFYHSPNEQKKQNPWIRVRGGYVDSQGRFYYPINGQVLEGIRRGGSSTEPYSVQVVYGGWVDTLGFYHSPNEQKGQNSWIPIRVGYVDTQGRFYYLTNQQIQWFSNQKSNLGYSVSGVNYKANATDNVNAHTCSQPSYPSNSSYSVQPNFPLDSGATADATVVARKDPPVIPREKSQANASAKAEFLFIAFSFILTNFILSLNIKY